MAAPFLPVDLYVLVRAGGAAGIGTLVRAALPGTAIESCSYTYASRFGCEDARISARLAATSEDFRALERVKDLGEVAIFARDPQHATQASHPFEPPPAFDSTQYVRLWSGRVAAVRTDPAKGRVEIEAEGWARILEERVVDTVYTGLTISAIVNALVIGLFPGGTDIQSTGKAAAIVDEFDAVGQTYGEAIDRLAALCGERTDWGVNRERLFFFKATTNPLHQSGGQLASVGQETELHDISIERDLRATRSHVRVFGGKASPTASRPVVTIGSPLAQTRFGFRQEDVLRDDVSSTSELLTLASAILRSKTIAPLRVRASVRGDVRYALDARAMPTMVLRTGRFVPRSYASEQLGEPGATASGFALLVVRSLGGYILVPVPDTAPIATPFYFETVRTSVSNPTAGQRYTLFAAPLNSGVTNAAVRCVEDNSGGTRRILVEQWNGASYTTVIAHTLASPLSGVRAAWGVSIPAGASPTVALYRDGTSVATGTGISVTASNLWVVGANEDLAEPDDAVHDDFACWNAARTATNFLSKLGAHTEAIRRWLGGPAATPMRFWCPMVEGANATALLRSGLVGAQGAALINVAGVAWVTGTIAKKGGGRIGPPLVLDERWGASIYGGSPTLFLDRLERDWSGDSGWSTSIEGGIVTPTVGRSLAEIERRLSSLEGTARNETGTVAP